MDFGKLDNRSSSEIAQPLTLRHQHNGEEIIDTKPCLVYVKGANARSVQSDLLSEAKMKLQEAKSNKSKKTEEEKTRALEDIQEMLIDSAMRVIDHFENIERDGKPLTNSKEDMRWFLDLNFFSIKSLNQAGMPKLDEKEWYGDSFAQQIIYFSNEVTNFLAEDLRS